MKRFVLLALPLAACATIAEPRVKAALLDAGLGERMAGCMAARMVDRLSIPQLRRLESLGGVGRRTSLPDFVDRTRGLRDAETLSVVTSAAAGCALRG